MNGNLVERSQWNSSWRGKVKAPLPLRPWRSYESWRLHRLFSGFINQADSVLEVGCGGSRFLPYFARRLGAKVSGFDYAPEGVELARAALSAADVAGEIKLGDLFGEAGFDAESFDVVWSAGFIEHFTDTADVVSRIARFAKPGGLVITEVPNMAGFIGKLHQWADAKLYAQHFVITPEKMDSAHLNCGMTAAQPARYFGTLELGVVGYGRHVPPRVLPWFNRVLSLAEAIALSPLWLCRSSIETEALSPLVVGVYRKRGTG